MAISEGMLSMLELDAAEAVARRRDDTQQAIARQRDGAVYDMRGLGGFMTQQLFASDNGVTFADLNAAVRTPTTIDHPSVPVGNPANTAPPK